MKSFLLAVLVGGIGCGEVQHRAVDAAPTGDAAMGDAPMDGPMGDALDLSPRLIFVTHTTYLGGSLGGLPGADAICQSHAQVSGLAGNYKAWLADATAAPATRMTRHAGPYQLVNGTVVAQGFDDLIDGTLLNKIDRTESGVLLGGSGCMVGPTCNFVCEGGEVWSNVDRAGNRRLTGDCQGWTSNDVTVSGTAGNDGKIDATWTEGTCSSISCGSALPLFCVQQ